MGQVLPSASKAVGTVVNYYTVIMDRVLGSCLLYVYALLRCKISRLSN